MSSRFLKFIIIVSIFVIYTSYKAIQLLPSQRIAALIITALVFLLMLGGMFLYRANISLFDAIWFRIFSWAGILVMGLWATFIIISIPLDIFRLTVFTIGKIIGSSEVDVARRDFLFRGAYAFTLALSGGLAGLGFLEVLRGPKVKEVSVPVKNLPPSLFNLKITQISDLHVGPTLRKGYVEEVVRLANATNPDLIFLTGDIADAYATSIAEHLGPLENLKSKFGSFYVTGNHEYYWGAEALIEKVKQLGFTPLLNDNAILQIGKNKILVAGVTDPAGEQMLQGHKPDVAKALSTKSECDFKILLAHRPDACIEAEALGANLQFSGHTHAGQFFPFSLFIRLAHKYNRGLYQHGQLWLYVNPGTGYWGPANRLGVMSEISVITLVNA
jgi:predicted MPP superfamily phosphohydrolase